MHCSLSVCIGLCPSGRTSYNRGLREVDLLLEHLLPAVLLPTHLDDAVLNKLGDQEMMLGEDGRNINLLVDATLQIAERRPSQCLIETQHLLLASDLQTQNDAAASDNFNAKRK